MDDEKEMNEERKMDDQAKAAFASAADTSKQLITLATAILALEVTFAKDFIGIATLTTFAKMMVGFSWGLFLISVTAGVWTLLALTGSLGSRTVAESSTIFASNIRIPAGLQVITFLAGLLATVVFGIRGALCPMWPFC